MISLQSFDILKKNGFNKTQKKLKKKDIFFRKIVTALSLRADPHLATKLEATFTVRRIDQTTVLYTRYSLTVPRSCRGARSAYGCEGSPTRHTIIQIQAKAPSLPCGDSYSNRRLRTKSSPFGHLVSPMWELGILRT